MKNKPVLFLLALALCVGAFAFPITAYADALVDTTPPTLTAKVIEGVLHIETSDAESGVEAVFINGNRINYRVNGSLDLVLRDYAGTGETVNIYAIAFATACRSGCVRFETLPPRRFRYHGGQRHGQRRQRVFYHHYGGWEHFLSYH